MCIFHVIEYFSVKMRPTFLTTQFYATREGKAVTWTYLLRKQTTYNIFALILLSLPPGPFLLIARLESHAIRLHWLHFGNMKILHLRVIFLLSLCTLQTPSLHSIYISHPAFLFAIHLTVILQFWPRIAGVRVEMQPEISNPHNIR